MSELTETRLIPLPRGGELEVQMSTQFMTHVAGHFGIKIADITDDHIRMFVWGAMKGAIDKVDDGGAA